MMLPLFKSHPDCTLCPLHSQAPGIPKTVGMSAAWMSESLPPSMNSAAVLVVGQNPGANEDQRGVPFVGASGKLVREVLVPGANLHKLASVYLTNGVRCFTVDNEVPKEACYQACRPYLLEDIAALEEVHGKGPYLFLGLGAEGAKNLSLPILGRKIGNLRDALKANGTLGPGGGAFFCTYHPAYVLRKRAYIHPVKDHLSLAAAWLKGNVPSESRPHIVPVRLPIRTETTQCTPVPTTTPP